MTNGTLGWRAGPYHDGSTRYAVRSTPAVDRYENVSVRTVAAFAACAATSAPARAARNRAMGASFPGARALKTRQYTGRPVFDALSDKLQSALGDLRGRGTLDDEAISRAMREVRLALLEADVNFEVVKQFVAQVRERALGADVQKSLTPGQQVVKIVHEELTELMGSGSSQIAFSPRPPTTILLAGLQGSGKTTAAGKL